MVFPDIVKGIGGDSADIVSVDLDVINAVSVVRTDCVGLAVTAFYAGASGVRDSTSGCGARGDIKGVRFPGVYGDALGG